jgi:hypothetical protein
MKKLLAAALVLLAASAASAQTLGKVFPEDKTVDTDTPPVDTPPAANTPNTPQTPPSSVAPENRGSGDVSSTSNDKPPSDAPPSPPAATLRAQPSLATQVRDAYPADFINRIMPGGFKILLHGYFRAPLRLTFADRGPAAAMMNEAQYNIRNPWLVDDDYFRSGFAYTRIQEQDWGEIYLGVGNKWLEGEVVFMGSLYSDWAQPLIANQFGLAQGYLTFHWDKDLPKVRFRLQLRGGAFWDRFGYLEKYDTYLFARTHQMGGQIRGEWSTSRLSVWLVQGVGAHLDDIASNEGLTLLNYVHLGMRWKRLFEAGLYYLNQLEQDQRQLKEIKDANSGIYGVDARLNTMRLGRFYLGGSIVTADQGKYLAPAVEVMHAYGGNGLYQNYFGTVSSDNGTGRLYNVAFEHRYSVADVLRAWSPERLHALHGGDIQLHWFGVATYVLSKQADTDPTINRNGRTYFKWGAELVYAALSWMSVSLRYDRVTLDSNDDANSFRILTPRISLRTHWLVDGEIYLQYSRYWYGARVQLRSGQVPLETQPDTDVFKIQAQLSF